MTGSSLKEGGGRTVLGNGGSVTGSSLKEGGGRTVLGNGGSQ